MAGALSHLAEPKIICYNLKTGFKASMKYLSESILPLISAMWKDRLHEKNAIFGVLHRCRKKNSVLQTFM